MNNYAAALEAIVADPDLQASLSAADSDDQRSTILTDAGITIPTESDVNAYNSDPSLAVEGAQDLTCEVFWIPE